jgi:hypothetical protein
VQASPPPPHFVADVCTLHVSPSQHPLQFEALHFADGFPPSVADGGAAPSSSSPAGCDGSVLAAGSVGVSVEHATSRNKEQAKAKRAHRRKCIGGETSHVSAYSPRAADCASEGRPQRSTQ